MTDERARLFVALALPEQVRAALGQWQSDRLAGLVSSLRMTAADDLHVTLCFLGSQPVSEITEIAGVLSALSGSERPVLTVGAPIWLPPRRPGVLAVELEDHDGALGRLQASLAGLLEARGFYEPERRPFRAHVTVARARRGARVRATDVPPPAPIGFAGEDVELIRSRLGSAGARYERLAAVRLSGCAG